jgi:hypothetical protein
MPPELCEVVGSVPRVKEALALAGEAAVGPVDNPPLNLGGMSRRRDQSDSALRRGYSYARHRVHASSRRDTAEW